MTFELVEGSAPPSLPSPFGPYDRRLGYALLPEIASRLKERQLVTVQQARASENMRAFIATRLPDSTLGEESIREAYLGACGQPRPTKGIFVAMIVKN